MRMAMLRISALALPLLTGSAYAETITLSCSVSAEESPPQPLLLLVRDGRVSYGQSPGAMVDAASIVKSSLVANHSVVKFKQNFPSANVVWDWNIDRASGEIVLKHISSQTRKTFLTKKGTCSER
jgi:hypothetical protein